jgi:class 3 adenylate cyclase
MPPVPSGTVTFVFTDIEGSTRLLQQLGDGYAEVTRDHRRILRECFGALGGTEVDTQGDAFFFSFPRASDAVRGAVDAQRALQAHAWPDGVEVLVRMGLHTGEPTAVDEGYVGLDVVRAARIASAGHGGQILLSETTRALIGNQLPEGVSVSDLGQTPLKDIQHERIYQLALDDGKRSFPPLRADHPKTAGDQLGERIQRHVEQRLERSFAAIEAGEPVKAPKGMTGLAATGLGILAMMVLVFVGLLVAVVLVLRAVF